MLNIDWDFISELEGGRILTGYVPDAGQSGVTIGTGIDLGYYGLANLRRLDPDLQKIILPYLHLIGDDARARLKLSPLTVTEAQAQAIESPKRIEMLEALSGTYLLDAGTQFRDLPDAAQTVMGSVTWQYGAPWRKCPRFWKLCCAKDWNGVEAELRNFGDAYPTRRTREADYLRDHMGLAT